MNERTPGVRARRVAIAIQRRVSEFLAREVNDSMLSGLMISRVEVSDDLGIAWVKVRLLVGGEDEKRRARAVRHLERAAPRMRRGVGSGLGLKRTPELRFDYDTGVDAQDRVEALLAEIKREKGGP